jgi:hypothetical protein
MFWHMSEKELDTVYKRYRNNIELLRTERPALYRMFESHLMGDSIADAMIYFNNWLFDMIYNDREEHLE